MEKSQTTEKQSEDLRFTPGRLHKTLAGLFMKPELLVQKQNEADPRADYADQLKRFEEGRVIRGRYSEFDAGEGEEATGDVFVAHAVDTLGESGFVVTVYADPEDGLSDIDLAADEPFTIVATKDSTFVPVTQFTPNPETVTSVEIDGLISILESTTWITVQTQSPAA